jgi:hypothetical protein
MCFLVDHNMENFTNVYLRGKKDILVHITINYFGVEQTSVSSEDARL